MEPLRQVLHGLVESLWLHVDILRRELRSLDFVERLEDWLLLIKLLRIVLGVLRLKLRLVIRKHKALSRNEWLLLNLQICMAFNLLK